MILNIYFHEEANPSYYTRTISSSHFFQQIKMYIQPRASFSHFLQCKCLFFYSTVFFRAACLFKFSLLFCFIFYDILIPVFAIYFLCYYNTTLLLTTTRHIIIIFPLHCYWYAAHSTISRPSCWMLFILPVVYMYHVKYTCVSFEAKVHPIITWPFHNIWFIVERQSEHLVNGGSLTYLVSLCKGLIT